ncbi:MAG TPA: hypothetical protein VJL07_01740 [Dehalococcoidia bacterium]|nr:hypothetical protein [Dehalococcoidia bacterium]
MSESVMVIVSDPDDAKHGEINHVESLEKAARLVETFLEAGFDQSRVRVFTSSEMDMRVRHRPVVALVTGDEAPDEASEAPEQTEKRPVASGTKAESPKHQEVAATPYEQNGVRFSTAFRPA